jgi:metal-responsive CopG/Arc/MetJ family transcriptional regulator
MTTVKATAFRFTADDLAILDAVQKHVGTSSRTEALRALLRYYVRAESIEVQKPRRSIKPKP